MGHIVGIAIAQAGWIGLALVHLDLIPTLAIALLLSLVELGGPFVMERKGGTPWHPHHLAERYCLLVILLVSAAPWIVVVGYETVGRRHIQEHLDGLRSSITH